MKPSRNYLAKVIAAGFVVLLLLSIVFFWARLLCEITLINIMPREAREVHIRPSGLIPKEIENDPNVARHSHVSADFYPWQAPLSLGTTDYFAARKLRGRLSNVYHYDEHGGEHCKNLLYFDKSTGLLVYHRTYKQRLPDKTTVLRTLHLYAGPEGISETPDEALGRFSALITDAEGYLPVTLFDKKLRRFFAINFKVKFLLKGPELAKDNSHNPIQIGSLGTSEWPPYPDCIPPMIKVPEPLPEENKTRHSHRHGKPDFEPIIKNFYPNYAGRYILVLDESGRIDLLDRKTLQFAGTAGYLPAPETFYPSKTSVRPKDLLSYRCLPVAIDREYIGMCVAGVSREGTAMAVAVFDSQGRLLRERHTKITEDEHRHRGASYIPSSKAVFFHVPWAPALTTAKYLLENLHPPILNIASFFAADSFDPAAGHRTLFFLPNSFIAMKGREVSEDVVGIYFFALLLISPSIILAGFLARRVTKDAAAVGLSKNAKLPWIIATIAFGLSAYITYRLTRPKMTLVTCANCGRLRRPDMDKCHCCGSKWFVPELTPPAWRVLD